MTKNRGLFWLLVVSLAVNLLIFGAVAGVMTAKKQYPSATFERTGSPPSGGRAFNGRKFFRALPPAERKKVRHMLASQSDEHRASARQVRQLRQNLYILLLAEQLDQARIEQALVNLRTAESREIERGQALILEILLGMDFDSRMHALDQMTSSDRRPDRKRSLHRGPPSGGLVDQ